MRISLRFSIAVVCIWLFAAWATVTSATNNRPIIGILSQPSDAKLLKYGYSFLAADYVQWIESAGARVVPVYFDAPPDVLEKWFFALNGIVFMGGPTDIIVGNTPYNAAARLFLDLSTAAAGRNDTFPVWGTCLGFEQINILVSGNYSLMRGIEYDSEDLMLPLNFTTAARASKMYRDMPTDLFDQVQQYPLTDNEHSNGISVDAFYGSQELVDTFNVLSTNVDRKGNHFISSIEGKSAPIFSTQWHPERPIFEWEEDSSVQHTLPEILVGQYMANFFVNECRNSMHKYASKEEEQSDLIYNFLPSFTEAITDDSYEQLYFLKPYDSRDQIRPQSSRLRAQEK